MNKIIFLTPEDVRYGFNLAGVDQIVVTKDEVCAVVEETVADKDTGILAIDERLADVIAEEKIVQIEQHMPGVLIIMPAPAKIETTDEDYTMRLIRRAIGYHVKLNV